jgi:hypothetical protein
LIVDARLEMIELRQGQPDSLLGKEFSKKIKNEDVKKLSVRVSLYNSLSNPHL